MLTFNFGFLISNFLKILLADTEALGRYIAPEVRLILQLVVLAEDDMSKGMAEPCPHLRLVQQLREAPYSSSSQLSTARSSLTGSCMEKS